MTAHSLLLADASATESERGFVVAILVVLAAATLVTMVLRRLRLATIAGYLITGAIIGPAALGLIRDAAAVESIKTLAVVLLMFTIGLHLDLSSMGRGMTSIMAVGVASTLGVVALAWPACMLLGLSAPPALAVAMAVSMSSTAVVLRIIQQKRETHRLHGRLCIGISIMQDLLSLAMLASLPMLARWAGVASSAGDDASGLGRLVRDPATALGGPTFGTIAVGALAVAGILLLILFSHRLLPRLLAEASREPTGESTLVLSAAVALGAALLTAWLGFSAELGAFIAGFMLASTPFRYHLAGQLSPMRDLFMAVFFTSVGLKLDFLQALHAWWAVVAGLALLVVIKAGVIALCVWAAGATSGVAARTAFLLAQAGEFTIVVLGVASHLGLLPPQGESIAIAVTVLSLIATPTLANFGERLQHAVAHVPPARWLARSALREVAPSLADAVTGDADGKTPDPRPHAASTTAANAASSSAPAALPRQRRAIIAGFGVIGRAVADHLEVAGVPYTVVELNAQTVQTQRRLNRHSVYGDIGSPEVLESAGVHDAEAVFLTVPDDDAIIRACQAIRRMAPHVFIAARTSYLSTAFQVQGAGADEVTIAEVAIAEDMARRVVARLKQEEPRLERVAPR